MRYQFYVPARTRFGAGMLNELHDQAMPGKKAMAVISSEHSVEHAMSVCHKERRCLN